MSSPCAGNSLQTQQQLQGGPMVAGGGAGAVTAVAGGCGAAGGNVGGAVSKLLTNTALDRDETGIEEKLDQCLTLVQSIVANVSEKEAIEALTQHVCRNAQGHEDISLGLLVGILTEPNSAARFYRDVTLVTRDGMQLFLNQLIAVVIERFSRLSDMARSQLLWLTRELIKNSVFQTDNVIGSLLRQIQGGDLSPKNVCLAEKLLDILCEYSLWLEKSPILLATCVYTYLRLIADHFSPNFSHHQFRQREIEFCSKTLREKFRECLMIGRDLVRALQSVAKIPEFESIWKDLIEQPTVLDPTLTGGIAQLLAMRTPRRFLQSRVTPDMDRKLFFLTHQVKLGQQRRYQEWFSKQYLSSPDAQPLRCDLIRFICCAIHPSNEILCSDMLPRWAVIGWLLSTCLTNVEASNCKLALFYDWLLYDADKDNIMNIEPAILVMYHSLRPHVQITATLWDFLIRIMREFHKPLADRIRQGVHTALRVILEKRVLPSLAPFFEHPRLDNELKALVRENFGEFYTYEMRKQIIIDDGSVQTTPLHHSLVIDANNQSHNNSSSKNNNNSSSDGAKFSDDEDENNGVFRPIKPDVKSTTPTTNASDNIAKLKEEVKLASKIKEEEKKIILSSAALNQQGGGGTTTVAPVSTMTTILNPASLLLLNNNSKNLPPSPAALDEFLDGLDDPFKVHITQLHKEKDIEKQCSLIETIIQDVSDVSNAFDRQLAKKIGGCLSHILNDEFQRTVLPEAINKDTLEDAVGTPLFVLLRSFCETSQKELRQAQLQILVEISQYQPKLSLLLLFYQRVVRVFLSRDLDHHQAAYRELVIGKNAKHNLEDALKDDLSMCEQTNNIGLLCFLVPEVYTQYTSAALGHSDLLHLVLSVIDSSQLKQLCCECLQGDLTMLNQDNFLPLAKASLHWETFEQMAFWSLLQAHRFQVEWLFPLVSLLNFTNHQEACNNVMLIFAAQTPTTELMQVLFARELQSQDTFVVSLLKHWAILCADVLAVALATMVIPQKAGNKRKRQTKIQAQQSTQQALLHIDELRQHCKDNTEFFTTEPLHSALQHAKAAASESQRSRFADLFALAANDSEEECAPAKEKTKSRSSNRGKRGAGSAATTASPQKKNASSKKDNNNKDNNHDDGSDTEYDSSTEEETSKPKPPRKKRKQLVSDSD